MISSCHLLLTGLNKQFEYFVMRTCCSHSSDETYLLGVDLGKKLTKNSILCFFGNLGAGKTTFIKGVVSGALGISSHEVNSPTFTYLNIYEGKTTVYHFDLYRLKDADEFLSMGFDEMFDAGGICCIEWSEKISSLIPENALCIDMLHEGGDLRRIEIKSYDERGL